jgi:hypothetical protein
MAPQSQSALGQPIGRLLIARAQQRLLDGPNDLSVGSVGKTSETVVGIQHYSWPRRRRYCVGHSKIAHQSAAAAVEERRGVFPAARLEQPNG